MSERNLDLNSIRMKKIVIYGERGNMNNDQLSDIIDNILAMKYYFIMKFLGLYPLVVTEIKFKMTRKKISNQRQSAKPLHRKLKHY